MFITNSYVVFAEEQIVALKGKLRETDSLLQEYEKRQVTALPNTWSSMAKWVASQVTEPKVATK